MIGDTFFRNTTLTKHSETASQQIDIYFRYIGKLMSEEVAEPRKTE